MADRSGRFLWLPVACAMAVGACSDGSSATADAAAETDLGVDASDGAIAADAADAGADVRSDLGVDVPLDVTADAGTDVVDVTLDAPSDVPADVGPDIADVPVDAGGADAADVPADTGPDVPSCPTGQSRCGAACVDLRSDPMRCGACDTVCPEPANASATCVMGACGISCATGFGDCDGDASNGCEAPLASSVNHCGTCGRACPTGPHATSSCAASACAVTCDTGFADCDMDPATGCEADLATTSSCGACGTVCAAGQECRAGACVTPRYRAFVYAPGAGGMHVYSPTINAVRLSLDVGTATPTALPTLTFSGNGALTASVPRDGVVRAEGDAPFVLWVHDGLSGDKIAAAGDVSGGQRGGDLVAWAASHVTVFTGDAAPSSVRVLRVAAPGADPVEVGTWTPGANQHRAFAVGNVPAVYRVLATGGSVTASGQLLNETYNHFGYLPSDEGGWSGTSFRYAEPAGAPGTRRLMVQSLTPGVDVTFTVGATPTARRLEAAFTVTSIEFPADTLARAQASAAVIAWVEADPNSGCDGTLLDADFVPSVRGETYDTEWSFRTNLAASTCFTSRRADVDALAYADDTVVDLFAEGASTPTTHVTINRGQRARLLTDAEPNRFVRVVTSRPARVEMSHDTFQFVVRAPSVTTYE
ncbi:MAG: hypothetical protein R3A52_22975 [Polyangiales bacterium]